MSVQTMKNDFLELGKSLITKHQQEEQAFINKCLDIIKDCCEKVRLNTLIGGNFVIYVLDGEVVFLHSGDKTPIKLYSEDGWTSIEDIAHWADIAIDMLKEDEISKENESTDCNAK